MPAPAIRVLIADDHKLFREMLFHSLDTETSIQIVGEAENGLEAVDKTRQLKPDVLLLDINMPEMDGLEATRLIKREMPHTKIVIITALEEEEFIFQLIKAGSSINFTSCFSW